MNDELWTFSGYFLDADGEPCVGAEITVIVQWQGRDGSAGVRSGVAETQTDGGFSVSIPLPQDSTPIDTNCTVRGEQPGYIEGDAQPGSGGWSLSGLRGATWNDQAADTISLSWDGNGVTTPAAFGSRELTLTDGDVTIAFTVDNDAGDATITASIDGTAVISTAVSGDGEFSASNFASVLAGDSVIRVNLAFEDQDAAGSATITLSGDALP